MSRFRIGRPSPALVVSTIALVVAMGGTGYAAFSLPNSSVGAKQLKNGAVTTNKIKNGVVTGAKISDGTITGAKIKLSTLGTVPNANRANTADTATNANHANNADTATNANHANNADTATNANHTNNADTATNANHTNNADTATNANHANGADSATNAGNASTVGGQTVTKILASVPYGGATQQIFSADGLTLTESCDGSGHNNINYSSTTTTAELAAHGDNNGSFYSTEVEPSTGSLFASATLNEGSINLVYVNGDTGKTVSIALGFDNLFTSVNTCGAYGTATSSG
jgi:hypothetical protein